MLSSSKNCMFIFKSQAAVRSRALGFTGEGAYNETYTVTTEKPVTQMVMKLQREDFLPSTPSPTPLKQPRTSLSFQSSPCRGWGQEQLLLCTCTFSEVKQPLTGQILPVPPPRNRRTTVCCGGVLLERTARVCVQVLPPQEDTTGEGAELRANGAA